MKRFLVTPVKILSGFFLFYITSPVLIAQDSLLLHLPFEYTVNGADGEIPVLTFGVNYEDGVRGQAAYLSGSAYMFFTKDENFDETKGTMEFWLKTENVWVPSVGYSIMSCGGAGGFLVQKDGASALRLMVNQHSIGGIPEGDVAYGTWALSTTGWDFITFTWGEDYIKMYLNGMLVDQEYYNYTFPDVTSATFRIGYSSAAIDEYKIYGRIKTPAEVLSSYYDGLLASIKEKEKFLSALSLSPNPADKSFTASWEFQNSSEKTILELSDMTGKILQTQEADYADQEKTFITSGLPEGIYTLRMTSGQRIIHQKLVISHR